jgi:hypothetical protein
MSGFTQEFGNFTARFKEPLKGSVYSLKGKEDMNSA